MSSRTDKESLDARIEHLLKSRLEGFVSLDRVARLTGGASREMHRLEVSTTDGPRRLALRRHWGSQKKGPGVSGLLTEAALTRLAGEVGIPSPRVEVVFRETDPDAAGLGDGFVMSWVDGETIGSKIVRSPELASARARMAEQCGRLLARLHDIDLDAHGLRDLLVTFTPEELLESTYRDYLELDQPEPMIDYAAQWLKTHLPAPTPTRLVHGDFRNGNLIVDPHGIAAVLDWETSCLGDGVRDLAWLCVNSWRYGASHLPVGGFGEIDDLLAAYEDESGRSVDRDAFLFWQVFGVFWWAKTTLLLASSYRQGTVRSPDRVVIGRRCTEAQIDLVNLLIPGPIDLPEAEASEPTTLASPAELVESVRDSIEDDFVERSQGRHKFLARVAVRNLSLVLRELEQGPRAEAREAEALRRLLGSDAESLRRLRAELCSRLRAGTIDLQNRSLQQDLRDSVASRVLIDQPDYSGLATALGGDSYDRKDRADR